MMAALHANAQRGTVLILSLVFLLLLTMLGLSSLQNATLQEKMAGALNRRQVSFQLAEHVLRVAEARVKAPGFALPECAPINTCGPPPEALTVSGAGPGGASGVTWEAVDGGFYALQNFAKTNDPVNVGPVDEATTLYRVTAVAVRDGARTVLESVHTDTRRIMWRQRQ
ncbi:MAG TPA: PilX N-terminal domain-containing pilus assembly protein [Pseudomonas sp.]|uniref:pilus assembly PilX family protein n=1 Tax=Pseudomonas sp. TaxID=306 RepID=UPI002EDAC971